MTRAKAKQLRQLIERIAVTLDDETALTGVELFPMWAIGRAYAAGDRVRHGGTLYKCVQAHTSQSDWTPDATPALFAKVLIPDETVIPEWVQPDSTNPYMRGDKVNYKGKLYESEVDNNVWEPGVYGWVEI